MVPTGVLKYFLIMKSINILSASALEDLNVLNLDILYVSANAAL